MPATTFIGHFLGPDTHANRPSATGLPNGTLYVCTTHAKIERVVSGAWADYATLGATGATVSSSTQSSSYTFAAADAGTAVESTSASAVTFTIPPNSSVAFLVGTIIEVYQAGAGQITIAGGAGVTLRSDGGKVKTAAQYATIGLRQRATNEWVLTGDLA